MARYKPYSYAQGKFIPVHFASQILPGTFEFTLNHLIDHELDLSLFDQRFRNDETGATAYDPRILLKIVLYAYSRGIVSSRKIEQACRENVIFMALSADIRPHFTTIADFISSMDREIVLWPTCGGFQKGFSPNPLSLQSRWVRTNNIMQPTALLIRPIAQEYEC
jgi:transposase